MRSVAATMTFALFLQTSGRRVAAFSLSPTTTANARTSATTNSKLSASFLEDLTRTFSSMAAGAAATTPSSKYFTVGITGSGGLIGTALRNELSQRKTVNGKPVKIIRLNRGSEAETWDDDDMLYDDDNIKEMEIPLTWNPKALNAKDVIDPAALQRMDAVIHLSGENISTGLSGPLAALGIRPWTPAKKQEILDSRTVPTLALAKAIGNSKQKTSFLVASGVGAYGPNFIGTGVAAADESVDISRSEGFLAEVSRQWEAASKEASKNGSRVVTLRNGVVLSTKGGALAKLYPIFFLGGGGIVGSGEQYFPFISARDMARAMVHVLETPKLSGPVNMCAPLGATNAEFTTAMGKVLKRPTILPFPAFAVSLLFGEMGEEVLLGGTRATPKKLMDSGFKFQHPSVEEAVASAVKESI
jgi:uncharacterized protein